MVEVAITVRAPYSWATAEAAALTALGVRPKLTENRSERTARAVVGRIGQDFAIHSGLTWSEEGERDPRIRAAWKVFAEGIGCCRETPHPALAAIGDTRSGCVGHGWSGLARDNFWIEVGAVVAVATLVDVHAAESCVYGECHPWGDPIYNGEKAGHLVWGNVRRLRTSVPAKGRQSVPWRLPGDVAAAVERELADA